MKAAMLHLSQIWPASLIVWRFADCRGARPGNCRRAIAPTGHAIVALLPVGRGGVFAFAAAVRYSGFGSTIGQPVRARWCAREGEKVVNMRLEATVLTETSRRVLQQLDGKHDRAVLAALVQRELTRGPPMTPQSMRRNTWNSFCKALPAAPCWSDEVPPPSTNHRSAAVYLSGNMQRVSRSAVGVGWRRLQTKVFTKHDQDSNLDEVFPPPGAAT